MKYFWLIIFLTNFAYAQEGRSVKDWFLDSVYHRYSGQLSMPGEMGTPWGWQKEMPTLEVSEPLFFEKLKETVAKNIELSDLVKLGQKHNVRITFVGNTATDLLQYAYLLARSEKGDNRPIKNRLDFHFSNIFPFSFTEHSPLEILLEGKKENVSALEDQIKTRFSFAKIRFVNKNNPGYAYDSYNRAFLELESLSFSKKLLADVLKQEISFDLNSIPESHRIIAIHNYIFKAALYALQVPAEVQQEIRLFLSSANTKDIKLTEFQKSLLARNEFLFNRRGYDQEYGYNLLAQIDPNGVLNIPGSKLIESDLYLPFKNKNFGLGKTAAELGITHVNHQTKMREVVAAIASSPYGKPNVRMSFAPGLFEESAYNARRGTGFYTMKGFSPWHPDWGNYRVKFRVNPSARLGKDFFIYNNEIIFRTNVLEVVYDQHSQRPIDMFKSLFFNGWDFNSKNPDIPKPNNFKYVDAYDVDWRFEIDLASKPQLRKEIDDFTLYVVSKSPSIYYIPTEFIQNYLALPVSLESSKKAYEALIELYQKSILKPDGRQSIYADIVQPALLKNQSKNPTCERYFAK